MLTSVLLYVIISYQNKKEIKKMISKEQVKNECLRRMKKLKLLDGGFETCVGDFRKNGTAWKSEFHGILYWLDDDEKQAVEEFEQKHKGLKVYHCYKAHTEFGELLSMLYVDGTDEESFEQDKEYFDGDIEDGYIMSYTKNMTDDFCSEFGSIVIRSAFGGIQRIG